MRPLTIVFLFLFLQNLKIRAFSNKPTVETLGGLIHDEVILTDRLRIEEESMAQLNKPITTANSSGVSIFCPTEELKFRRSNLELMNISCNLTYWKLASPIVVSFETDIQDIAILSPAFWIYLSPSMGEEVVSTLPLRISVRTFRMGSTFLKVWIREAKPGGVSESIHPFSRQNASQVKEYHNWIMKTTSIDNETSAMGFHLRILRPRGAFEFAFRIIIIILVCGITFLMGCELDGRQIWMHLKKPVGPVIGFLCQFGLMPLVSGI